MSNEDYELWAAMMAEEKPTSGSPDLSPPVLAEPAPETPKFFPLIPVAQPPAAEVIPPVAKQEAPPMAPPAVSPYETRIPEFVTPVEPPVAPPVAPIEPTLEAPVRSFVPSAEDLDEDDEIEFPTNLFKEPQTNSITVPEVPDALTSGIITGSGETLKTGAIDLPILNNTGSIPIITITPDEIDEEAIKADMGGETTGGIPPIRSGSVMNSSARVGVLPIKNRRSEGQTILLATSSILLLTMGAALIAAYMLKLI